MAGTAAEAYTIMILPCKWPTEPHRVSVKVASGPWPEGGGVRRLRTVVIIQGSEPVRMVLRPSSKLQSRT
jgi:hypothetical protein